MGLTFFQLIEALSTAGSAEELDKIALQLSAFLKEDSSLSAITTLTLVNEIISDTEELQEIVDSEFFKSRSNTYQDYDGRHKIALGIAFIQDYRIANPRLETVVLESLCKKIMEKNLGLIINDVSVNNLQLRDFAGGSFL